MTQRRKFECIPDEELTAPDQLLTPEQVAEKLGIAVSTLAVWRCRGRYGLSFVKVGSAVRYWSHAVDDFLRRRERSGDSAK